MKEAAENKGELQKNAEEQSEGKGSQNPDVTSVLAPESLLELSRTGKVTS